MEIYYGVINASNEENPVYRNDRIIEKSFQPSVGSQRQFDKATENVENEISRSLCIFIDLEDGDIFPIEPPR